jgi:hypothetical protein
MPLFRPNWTSQGATDGKTQRLLKSSRPIRFYLIFSEDTIQAGICKVKINCCNFTTDSISSRYPFNENNRLICLGLIGYGAEIDKYTEHLLDSFLSSLSS